MEVPSFQPRDITIICLDERVFVTLVCRERAWEVIVGAPDFPHEPIVLEKDH